jgi:hypothetical protein
MVLGWIAKIAITVALVGMVGFDAIALAQGHVRADDAAGHAADEAATSYGANADVQKAVLAARTAAAEDDMTVTAKDVKILADGTIIVTVKAHIDTTLLRYVPGIANLSDVMVTATRKAVHQ